MSSPKATLYFVFISIFTLFITCTSKPAEKEEPATEEKTGPPITSARPVHWAYEGDDGPAGWASLSPVYALCGNGMNQSPIDISTSGAGGGVSWKFNYKTTSLKIAHTEHMDNIIDNGHTIQVTVDEGSTFTFGEKSYGLKQFHFHTPSEHTVDGEHLPMEMHMVHQADDGNLAVVSILFRESETANPNIQQIIDNLPPTKGETNHVEGAGFTLNVHMPKDNYAYHYIGSLTTPPCTENVQWMVLRDRVSVTSQQVRAMSSRIGPNNRPVQPLNKRAVEGSDIVAD